MWQQIYKNKKNTFLIITAMFFLLIFIGSVLGVLLLAYFDKNNILNIKVLSVYVNTGIIFAVITWVVLLITTVTGGNKTLLSINKAYKLPKGTHLILENVVEEMTIASGLPKKPSVYVIDMQMPNAYATGLNPQNSAIAVTTGLLTILDRDELQGVIAHEIAHIYNRDTMYMMFSGIMIASITILSEIGIRIFFNNSSRRSNSSSSGSIATIFIIIGIIVMILAPIAAQLLYFLVSQKREYLADACAAQFTRYPQGLASALQKISSYTLTKHETKVDKITAPMCIINPASLHAAAKLKKQKEDMFNSVWSTHPPTIKRIEVLLKMTGADFKAYNTAFMKISGRKLSVLNKKDLMGVKRINIEQKHHGQNENDSQILKTAVIGSAVLSAVEQKTLDDDFKTRKRNAEDIMWKANNYIFKKCQCGTKLKFPYEYKGQQIKCPHCGNIIDVSE